MPTNEPVGTVITFTESGEEVAGFTLSATSTFFIGHNDQMKSYDATVRSIRFYDRALSAEELAANAQAVGTLKAE